MAKGESFRDADVALMLAGGVYRSPVELGALSAELARAVGIPRLAVDLVDLEACNLPFKQAVLVAYQVLVDREPGCRYMWEAETTLLWLDFEPCWREQEALRRRSLLSAV
jgi:hypothetical protein